jgi:hypothetical protein
MIKPTTSSESRQRLVPSAEVLAHDLAQHS